MHAPLDALDIGRSRSRWPGEPNFENGKLVCPVSTFIRSFDLPSFLPRSLARSLMGSCTRTCTHVQPTGPEMKRRLGESRGSTRRSLFRPRVQSVSSHWTHDTSHSYSPFFTTVGRSVGPREREGRDSFGFFAEPRKGLLPCETVKCARVKIPDRRVSP